MFIGGNCEASRVISYRGQNIIILVKSNWRIDGICFVFLHFFSENSLIELCNVFT